MLRHVGDGCHPHSVEVTAIELARVPAGNIRVPRAQFATVWAAAETRSAGEAARGITDWYAGGVVATCRWLAGAAVTDQNGWRRLPRSPATGRIVGAYEELIEAEYLAAEGLDLARRDLVEHRPGWCEAIRATLRWAWRCNGPAPLAGVRASAGLPGQ